jgi:hypothetical protein
MLNNDTTPVGVGLGVVPVHDVVAPCPSSSPPELVSWGSEWVTFKLGQHSGLSSEHPIRGTWRAPPSAKYNIVY